MIALGLMLALSMGAPPRGKPVVPRLMAASPFDARGEGRKGVTDLFDAPTPTLAAPVRWLMVGVSSLIPLDETPLSTVELTVTFPGGDTQVFKALQKEYGDVDWSPFWVDLRETCGEFKFTVKVREDSVTRSLTVRCPK
ncbi:MAG: hypothetical protein U0228_04080 [Myxococcaceae bacterium]